MTSDRFRVERVEWMDADARAALTGLRFAIFVHEQGVPEEMELDEEEDTSAHFLAVSSDGAPIGCGRLTAAGQIGRMCVDAAWRGKGVGAALLASTIRHAETRSLHHVHLHAQETAIGFYAKYGFEAVGERFMEAGIPHLEMKRTL